jgi:hypothetical protein
VAERGRRSSRSEAPRAVPSGDRSAPRVARRRGATRRVLERSRASPIRTPLGRAALPCPGARASELRERVGTGVEQRRDRWTRDRGRACVASRCGRAGVLERSSAEVRALRGIRLPRGRCDRQPDTGAEGNQAASGRPRRLRRGEVRTPLCCCSDRGWARDDRRRRHAGARRGVEGTPRADARETSTRRSRPTPSTRRTMRSTQPTNFAQADERKSARIRTGRGVPGAPRVSSGVGGRNCPSPSGGRHTPVAGRGWTMNERARASRALGSALRVRHPGVPEGKRGGRRSATGGLGTRTARAGGPGRGGRGPGGGPGRPWPRRGRDRSGPTGPTAAGIRRAQTLDRGPRAGRRARGGGAGEGLVRREVGRGLASEEGSREAAPFHVERPGSRGGVPGQRSAASGHARRPTSRVVERREGSR